MVFLTLKLLPERLNKPISLVLIILIGFYCLHLLLYRLDILVILLGHHLDFQRMGLLQLHPFSL